MVTVAPSPPKSGWTCVEVIDVLTVVDPLNPETIACEICSRSLRWSHIIEHPAWPERLITGCCCAARLCSGYDARAAEQRAMNQAASRERFIAPKQWKRSAKGNWWRRSRGRVVTIFSQGNEFVACIAVNTGRRRRPDDPQPQFTSRCETERDAKIAAWEKLNCEG